MRFFNFPPSMERSLSHHGAAGYRSRASRSLLLAALAALAVTGCAETRLAVNTAKEVAGQGGPAQIGAYKVGRPYQIDGVWYYPAEDYSYAEEGVASWYGPNFHGKLTANGEVYDQMDLTAAHRTLPMPSLVRVTNLENGRSLVVRINDRGPFARNRIIDLSKRSAELLGVIRQGTARVRVEVLADESRALKAQAISNSGEMPNVTAAPRTPVAVQPLESQPVSQYTPPAQPPQSQPIQLQPANPAPVTSPAPIAATAPVAQPLQPAASTTANLGGVAAGTYVQVGAFSSMSNAQQLQANLQGISNVVISPVQVNGQELYRVRLGPLGSQDVDRVLSQAQAQGFPGAQVVVEP